MRQIILIIMAIMLLAGTVGAEQVWVKTDAQLKKKLEPVSFKVTEKMKTAVLKLPVITVHNVKKTIRGNRQQALQVIQELEKEGKVTTYEKKYNELYPAPREFEPDITR